MQNGHLSPGGYNRLMESFFQTFAVYHDHGQMKNHWEHLKGMYKTWLWLLGQERSGAATGLGWSEDLGTVVAPEWWWTEHKPRHRFLGNFQYQGLHHRELMDIVFAPITAEGANLYYGHQGPARTRGGDGVPVARSTGEGSGDSDEMTDEPEPATQLRSGDCASATPSGSKRPSQGTGGSGRKKRMTNLDRIMQQYTSTIIDLKRQEVAQSRETVRFDVSISYRRDPMSTSGTESAARSPSILDRCIRFINEAWGVEERSSLFVQIMMVLDIRDRQEVFLRLPEDHRWEWMAGKLKEQAALQQGQMDFPAPAAQRASPHLARSSRLSTPPRTGTSRLESPFQSPVQVRDSPPLRRSPRLCGKAPVVDINVHPSPYYPQPPDSPPLY